MIKLTKLEATAFKAIRNTCKVDAWSDVESIVEVTGMSAASVKGVVGSLVKKDMVMVGEDEINGVKHKSIYYIDKNNFQVFFGEVEGGQPDYHTDEEIEEMVTGKPAKVEKVVEVAAQQVEEVVETVEDTKVTETQVDEETEEKFYEHRNGKLSKFPTRRKGTKLSKVKETVSAVLTDKGITVTFDELRNKASDLRKLEKEIAGKIADEWYDSNLVMGRRMVSIVFDDIANNFTDY